MGHLTFLLYEKRFVHPLTFAFNTITRRRDIQAVPLAFTQPTTSVPQAAPSHSEILTGNSGKALQRPVIVSGSLIVDASALLVIAFFILHSSSFVRLAAPALARRLAASAS